MSWLYLKGGNQNTKQGGDFSLLAKYEMSNSGKVKLLIFIQNMPLQGNNTNKKHAYNKKLLLEHTKSNAASSSS